MFECLIVGAGPAGASAAYHLAKQGMAVLMLDKSSFPRAKVCGGGVSPMIAQWFDVDFTPVIENRIKQVQFSWQQNDPITAQLQGVEPMWIVQRDTFDHFLVQQAQQQGANFQDQTPVTQITRLGDHWQVETEQGSFEAAYLIAADGVSGPTAKWLGFPAPQQTLGATLTIPASVPDEQRAIAYFDFGTIKNGYIWQFPNAMGYTISTGMIRSKGKPKNLQKALSRYATQFGLDAQQGNYREYALNLWKDAQPLHTDHALLAGETAGILDPLSGEGIRPAVLSGVKAAEAITFALSGVEHALAQYTKTIQTAWGDDMVLAQRLARLFYQFPKLAYKVGVKRPLAAQTMGKILTGELRYCDVTDMAIKQLKSSLIPGRGQ